MINGYLKLDKWETEGDKVEATRRIVEAYLSDSEVLDLRGLGLTRAPEGLTKLHNVKSIIIKRPKPPPSRKVD